MLSQRVALYTQFLPFLLKDISVGWPRGRPLSALFRGCTGVPWAHYHFSQLSPQGGHLWCFGVPCALTNSAVVSIMKYVHICVFRYFL